MKKFMVLLMLCSSFLFAINLQTASKEELMGIKGIGEKKAEQILEYRKVNSIKSPEDLRNIKGFGDSIINNVKNDVKAKGSSNKGDEKEVKDSKEKESKQDKKSKKDNETKK
ncbi:ComEA family DNA-binding protein [Aliarcobacter vitoriensis]|uniref:Competence protein ComEA n=1 Tax=Aliarcobacter vitoriensis TaxID=2011099 RepID=A0A366MT68_9BACT|nr:helix-hairpin-helix domain-containing protein [Aliarcobacter vitoriensis]RBQ29451.1 competence protein ComEA [Aliarcobacter vitoriensis]